MSTVVPTIPPDNPKRALTLARPDNLPHIGLVGDTYTITVTGEQTDGRFCVIDTPPNLDEKEQATFIEKVKALAGKYHTELLREA